MNVVSAINTRVRRPISKALHKRANKKEDPYANVIRAKVSQPQILPQLEVWKETRELLYKELQGDYSHFMAWPSVQNTMFVEPDPRSELAFLKKDWKRWEPILQETWLGNPKPYPWYLKTSGNLLHNVYNLAYFLEKTGVDITTLNSIVEFGGGYGALCKAVYDMGFKGSYSIFDFPEVHLLQDYYLTATGVTGHTFISEIEEMGNPDLFIAYWSLTESPFELRDKIFAAISPKYYSVTFSGNFRGYDNLKYFEEHLPKGYDWTIEPRPRYRDTFSLIGVKK